MEKFDETYRHCSEQLYLTDKHFEFCLEGQKHPPPPPNENYTGTPTNDSYCFRGVIADHDDGGVDRDGGGDEDGDGDNLLPRMISDNDDDEIHLPHIPVVMVRAQ